MSIVHPNDAKVHHGLSKVASHLFANSEMDFWRDERGDIYMTSDQIGNALEYSYPVQAIQKIFERNEHRLLPNSTIVKMTTVDGRDRDVRIFNEKAIYEIVRKSNQPKADQFYDWVYEVLQAIRKTGSYIAKAPDERQVRVELLKTAIEHEERLSTIEQRIEQVERSTTLDHGEQRRLQKAIAHRVCSLAQDERSKRDYFKQLYREVRDRWAVASYRDVLRVELDEVVQYVGAWKPRVV